MTWYTTKVESSANLASELNRLQTALHTIFKIINKDGAIIIISNTTP